MKKNIRYFIDMDGTLCPFNKEASMEEISSAGYFYKLAPYMSMINAIGILSLNYEVYILSHVISEIAQADKNAWLDKYMPFINEEHRIFVPYGSDKYKAILERCNHSEGVTDVLVDDFTENLKSWKGVGIKALNNINNSKRTWSGMVVNTKATYAEITAGLKAVEFLAELGA